MKKVLLIALLLTLATGTAIAQSQQGPGGQGPGGNGNPGNYMGGNPGNPVDRLTDQLGLDTDQAIAVAAIFEENQLARFEEQERAHQANCEIRISTHEQILALLTPEQALLFEEHQLKRDELRRALDEMRQAHGGGFGGERGLQDCGN